MMRNKVLEKYGVSFGEVDLEPSRGWYSIFPFKLPQKINFKELNCSLKDNESIVLVRINIGNYKDRALDMDALRQICYILDFFMTHDREMILRFVYDDEGKGLQNEPDNIEQIQEHMRQIGSNLIRFSQEILTIQGIFVGSWGEMHSSRYLDPESIKKLMFTLYEATRGQIRLAVRKPSQREILEELNCPKIMRLTGFYNDALMASDTDYGTFEEDEEKREAQRDYIADCCRQLVEIGMMCGGEAVNDNILNDGENAAEYLRRLNVTYLNSQYDSAVIDKWKKTGVYDEIGEHLGYRIELESVKSGLKELLMGRVKITLKNTGYAALYEPVVMALHREDKRVCAGRRTKMQLGLGPGESCTFSFERKKLSGGGEIFLERMRDSKRIQIREV